MSSTTSAHPNPSTISLPPISSIDPHRQRTSPSPAELHYEYLQQQHSVSRQLPVPVSYEYANMPPNMLRHDGMPGRPIYPGGPAYQMSPGRMPLPPATDPNLMIAGRAHQKKEVKRRTKTGCLTCRKRRIKCDEARPECRNCLKSKRECSGYGDTPGTFQSASTSPRPQLQSASTSHQLLAPVPSTSSSIHQQALLPLTSPSLSSKAPSVKTESSLDPGDYPTPKHESALPPLQYHRPKTMDGIQESRGSLQTERPYQYTAIRRAIPRSIDDLCTIDGNRRPNLPPLPSDTPNLDAIQKIYDAAFAPGLDKLLETRWYSKAGFSFLVSDHDLLAQFLAYITMIHSNQNNLSAGPSAALASQEARITWALMSLCSKAELPLAETRILTRRFNALESLITAQLVANPSLLIEDVDEDIGPESGSVLQKQIAQRGRDFWSSLTHFVSLLQACSSEVENTSQTAGLEVELSKCRARLDNFENRDVIFSIMQLHFLSSGHSATSDETPASQQQRSGRPHESGATPTRHQEWYLAKDFLDKEAGGQSTTQVLSTVCGIALRAWDEVR